MQIVHHGLGAVCDVGGAGWVGARVCAWAYCGCLHVLARQGQGGCACRAGAMGI